MTGTTDDCKLWAEILINYSTKQKGKLSVGIKARQRYAYRA